MISRQQKFNEKFKKLIKKLSDYLFVDLSYLNETLSTIFLESQADFEKFTCIKFQPRKNETAYLDIKIDKNLQFFCGRSYVGKQVNEKGQEVTCFYFSQRLF